MPQFFVPRWQIVLIGFLLFYLLISGSFEFFSYLLIFYSIFLFLLRKKKSSYRDDLANDREVITSPVNGTVVSIQENIESIFFGKNLTMIQINILPWNESGLYLPISGEVSEVKNQLGQKILRKWSSFSIDQSKALVDSISLKIKGKNEAFVGIQLIRCFFGASPNINILPGDRGKCRVCFGHFPLGGTVLLYLDRSYEVLLKSGDQMIAGETLVGGLKDL